MADGYALWSNGEDYDPAKLRMLDNVLATPAAATAARAGVRPGPGLGVTVGGSPELVTVSPGGGIIRDPAGSGSHSFVIPTAVSKALATRPPTGTTRIDSVVARLTGTVGSEVRQVDIVVVAGAPSSSPSPPSLASGDLLIQSLTVPPTGSVAVGARGPRTVALGGVLPVASAAERDAVANLGVTLVYREDLDVLQRRTPSGWASLAENFTGTVNAVGNGTSVTPLVTVNYPARLISLLGTDTPRVQVTCATFAAGAYFAGVQDVTSTSMKVAVRRLDSATPIANGAPVVVHYRLDLP